MKNRVAKWRAVFRPSRGVAIPAVALAAVALMASQARAQTATASGQTSDPQFQQLIRSVEGPNLYRAYCSSCHGSDAKGNGPAAASLKAKVPNLTLLAANNGGRFPAERIRKVIMGDETVASHGSRQMPVWGPIFHQIEQDVDRGNVRLENLVKYLETIQAMPAGVVPKPAKKVSPITGSPPSGAQLYKQNCSLCHADDGKGNGLPPAYSHFQAAPPDLTTLAQRNHGLFPDAYVAQVLMAGINIPDHGPAEMPAWGIIFKSASKSDEAQVAQRIASLSDYLKSMQAK